MGRTICHRLIPLSLRHPGGKEGKIKQYKSKGGEFHWNYVRGEIRTSDVDCAKKPRRARW